MARKNIRTSNRSKEITYKDVEKALQGRDLNNLSYKDMYELDQLGFGDWLGRNWGNVAQIAGGAALALTTPITGPAGLAGIGMMTGGVTGIAGDMSQQAGIKSQNEATDQQNALMQRQAQEQALMQRTAGNPTYGAMFAEGGVLDDPENTAQASPQYTWRNQVNLGKQHRVDNPPEPEYYVSYGGNDYRIEAHEKDEVERFFANRAALSNFYFGRQPGLRDKVEKVVGPKWDNDVYNKAILKDPSLEGEDYTYPEIWDLAGVSEEDRELDRKYADRFFPTSNVTSARERGRTGVHNTRYAVRNAIQQGNVVVQQKQNLDWDTPITIQERRPSTRGKANSYDTVVNFNGAASSIPAEYFHDIAQVDNGEILAGLMLMQGGDKILDQLQANADIHPKSKEKYSKQINELLESNFSGLSPQDSYIKAQEMIAKSTKYLQQFPKEYKSAYETGDSLFKNKVNPNSINPVPKPQYAHGGTINYEGQSHEGPNQGIPVDEMGNPSIDPVALTEGKEVAYSSDQGTYIFSDRLKYSDSKTFAQRAKDLQKKYELRAKTKGGTFQLDDPISKKGYDMEMQKLIGQQEQLKEMTMPQQQPQQMGYGDMPMFRYGNYLTSEFAPRLTEAQARSRVYSDILGKDYISSTVPPTIGEYYTKYPQQQTAPNKTRGYPGFHGGDVVGVPGGPAEYKENPLGIGEDFGIKGSEQFSTPENAPGQQYQGMSLGQAALSAIPDVAAGITNLIRGGNRRRNNPYSKLNAPYMVAEQINLENERAAAREQANVARANVSRGMRMGAPTAGSYMANMIAGETGIQRGLGQQLGQSYQNEATANAQMRQQAAMANQQMEMQARGYNTQMEAQNRAQADAMTGAGISQIGQGITGAYNQYAADRRHVQALNMQSPDYALYHDEGSKWYNQKFSKRLTPEGRMNQEYQRQLHSTEAQRYRELGKTSPEELIKELMQKFPNITQEQLTELFNQYTE